MIRHSDLEAEVELTHIFIPAGHDVSDHLVSIQCVLPAHDAQRDESPVDPIHTEMFRHVVSQVIFMLREARGRGMRLVQG